MKSILIFAGTTEGRKLAELLGEAQIPHTVCVATEYGEIVLKENPFMTVKQGRMSKEEMKIWMESGMFAAVVDATHPYADVVTEHIREAICGLEIPYFRLQRTIKTIREEGEIHYFSSQKECAEALHNTEGNILLTTGSKELSLYCKEESLKRRLFVRVLPGMESLSICAECGLSGKQIIAMQGPFTEELNEALIHQFQIQHLVTKVSGTVGGYPQKIMAAKRAGISCFVIGHEASVPGMSFVEVCSALEQICNTSILKKGRFSISLVGIGVGNPAFLTQKGERRIREAEILLGAERMIAPYSPRIEKKPYYRAPEIIPYLKELQNEILEEMQVTILFSGDTGFYSGASHLYSELQKAMEEKQIEATLELIPGISSVSYLASRIGVNYQDAKIVSIHGKKEYHLIEKIRTNEKIFLLVSGVQDVQKLGKLLQENRLEHCKVIIGYQLSYSEEEICVLSAKQCEQREKEGLYLCFVYNPQTELKSVTHGLSDAMFYRENVPMTKEEIREAVISKMQLYEGAVVADIGCGSGSIAVEIARLSDSIHVYGIEKKKEAVELSKKNKEKFQIENLDILEGEASEVLQNLGKMTHAFIGGSGGRLRNILQKLYENNEEMQVVMTAVTVETFCKIQEISNYFPIKKAELVQLQVSRGKKLGAYHLMQAENPVWIYAFQFAGRK